MSRGDAGRLAIAGLPSESDVVQLVPHEVHDRGGSVGSGRFLEGMCERRSDHRDHTEEQSEDGAVIARRKVFTVD
jgi:hypothetical protein